jgi:hypothetical protein
LGHVRLLNAFQDNRGGWLAVPLGLEERVPDTAKDQYGETGTDGQQRQHRGAGFGSSGLYSLFAGMFGLDV